MENRRDPDPSKLDKDVPLSEPSGGANSLVPVAQVLPARATSRSTRRIGLIAVAASLIAAGGLWFTLGGGLGPPSVPIQTLVEGPVSRVLAVTGRTAAETEVNITAATSARVEAVLVFEGDQVAAEDLLVTLDGRRQQLVVRQAMSSLDAAILARQAAREDANRAAALGESISATAREDAERALLRAENEVTRLTAALEQAQIGLSDFRITAPFAGTVLIRSVDPGDQVDPARVLMRLADLDPIHVEVEVDETYAAVLRMLRRRALVPFVLVPRKVANQDGSEMRSALLQNLKEAQDAFVHGTPVACVVLLRATVEVALKEHYRSFGTTLKERIESVRGKLPLGATVRELHELRELANALLHDPSTRLRTGVGPSDAETETNVVAMLVVVRGLIEGIK